MPPLFRERKIERRALPQNAFGPVTAAVAMNYSLNVREPDTGALELFRPVQALEKTEELVLGISCRSPTPLSFT